MALVYGWLDTSYADPYPQSCARRRVIAYEGMRRDEILADIEIRKAEIRVAAQRGLVRDQVYALLTDISESGVFSEPHDDMIMDLHKLEAEGQKSEAVRYLELARSNSAKIDVSHEIWKMESFLMDVVFIEKGESEEDWSLRAYPVIETTKEEIAEIRARGTINQAKTLLSIIRILSQKGLKNLNDTEQLRLGVCLKGLELSLSRAGRNLNSIGTSREELKPVRDLVGEMQIPKSYLHSCDWLLKLYSV